jgi:RNA polymerase sigma-70 factor (ECF subfamily)
MRAAASSAEKHVEYLYPLVRSIVSRYAGSLDQCDDWTQEAFVEILGSLKRLRRREALRSWAATITRRVCYRMKNKERGDPAPALQEGMAVLRAGADDPERQELGSAVRRALAHASEKYRQILVLYYFEDRSVKEVAEIMHISAGAAKRWLHEGRAALGKELMVMPETQEIRNNIVRRPFANLMWWGEGCLPGTTGYPPRCWPWVLFDSLLAQQILFSARKEAKSLEEICRAVGADRTYVADLVESFVRNELMVASNDGFRTDFVFIGKDDQKRLHGMLADYGKLSADIVSNSLSEIRNACKPELLWGKNKDWENLRWVVVCPLLCGLAVSRQIQRLVDEKIDPPIRPDGHHFYLFAWQGHHTMEEGGWQRSFGIRWVTGNNMFAGCSIGFFWTPQAQREVWPGNFSPYLLKATFGPEPVQLDRIAELVRRERGVERLDLDKEVARLLELGLVERIGGKLRPTFPVFTARFWNQAGPAI